MDIDNNMVAIFIVKKVLKKETALHVNVFLHWCMAIFPGKDIPLDKFFANSLGNGRLIFNRL